MENKEMENHMKLIEEKVSTIESDLDDIKEGLKTKTDEDAVRVLIDKTLADKRVINESEANILNQKTENKIESTINKVQVKMVKWMIAIVISTASITFALFRIFM
ncbi:hypothetical protein LGQ02_15220 [Bacillus shivajii]|uniref:hypothetical protein n=1 Tax=Bacillus shivajii TaxID=1983719 RepID=UPI001CFB5391|nr:hypothetical protein [Bacillus shivajii]UCZ52185.1 hypothetical protein LGQ02_15220 [Bacillus shivajii]